MKANTPVIAKLPQRRVLTLTTVGNPNAAGDAIKALYMTAYQTKFMTFKPRGIKMEVGKLSAFWPDAHLKPKSKWTGIWNLEVPLYVKASDLLFKHPTLKPKLVALPAGTYGQILHVGTYATEGPTIKLLHAFIKAEKFTMAGPHEEVYLTKPGPKAKTLIQYRLKKG